MCVVKDLNFFFFVCLKKNLNLNLEQWWCFNTTVIRSFIFFRLFVCFSIFFHWMDISSLMVTKKKKAKPTWWRQLFQMIKHTGKPKFSSCPFIERKTCQFLLNNQRDDFWFFFVFIFFFFCWFFFVFIAPFIFDLDIFFCCCCCV